MTYQDYLDDDFVFLYKISIKPRNSKRKYFIGRHNVAGYSLTPCQNKKNCIQRVDDLINPKYSYYKLGDSQPDYLELLGLAKEFIKETKAKTMANPSPKTEHDNQNTLAA